MARDIIVTCDSCGTRVTLDTTTMIKINSTVADVDLCSRCASSLLVAILRTMKLEVAINWLESIDVDVT